LIDCEENDAVDFDDLMINRMDKQESDLFYIRDLITTTPISSRMGSEDEFSLLENAIQQGNINLAIKLIKQTKNYLKQENNEGETPLLLAAKFNQNRLIIAILKKQPELAKQVDKQGNNLLHLLANVKEDKAKKTIENVLTLLDNRMKECLISGLNQRKQTPEQVARKYDNMEYIDLLNRQINFSDCNL
jgi:ankyrin repeat protein